MMPLNSKVNPGVRDGRRVVVTSLTTTNYVGNIPLTPVQSSYTGNSGGDHNRSGIVKSTSVNGWRPPLPYRSLATRVDGSPYDFTTIAPKVRYNGNDTDRVGGIGPPAWLEYHGTRGTPTVPDVSTNMESRAITEALNKIKDNKLQLIVSLLEAKKSIGTVSSLVITAARALQQVRRGNYVGAVRILTGSSPGKGLNKDPSRGWLQVKYGLVPIMLDIKGALAAAERGLRKPGQLVIGHRVLTQNYGLPKRPFDYNNQGAVWEAVGKCDVGVECKLYAAIDNPYADLALLLGLENPLVILWELVPYSFVVDWFLPIGNFLSALTASVGVVYKGGFVNHKLVSNFSIRACRYATSGGSLPTVRYQANCQLRKTYVTMPLPRLYLKSPFSTSNVASAIALLRQLR